MSEENLKACSIAYAKHKALNQLFENNSDCRADTWGESHDTIPPTMVEGEVIRAMTKDKFVEIITPLINTRQSPQSRDEWIKNKLITGRMYYQISCEKWLKYVGKTDKYNDGIWYQFHFDGKLYNELRFENVKSMFDFNKPPKQVSQL